MLVTVLYARAWDFSDKETGKRVMGGEMIALPASPAGAARDGEKGQKPLTMKMAHAVFGLLPASLPAKCELVTDLRQYQGQASVYVVGAESVQVPK